VRIPDEDFFIWSGTGQPVQGYTNWDTENNQPDNVGDCIMIHASYKKWWDNPCSIELVVICEE
jgi:hypothetical protein